MSQGPPSSSMLLRLSSALCGKGQLWTFTRSGAHTDAAMRFVGFCPQPPGHQSVVTTSRLGVQKISAIPMLWWLKGQREGGNTFSILFGHPLPWKGTTFETEIWCHDEEMWYNSILQLNLEAAGSWNNIFLEPIRHTRHCNPKSRWKHLWTVGRGLLAMYAAKTAGGCSGSRSCWTTETWDFATMAIFSCLKGLKIPSHPPLLGMFVHDPRLGTKVQANLQATAVEHHPFTGSVGWRNLKRWLAWTYPQHFCFKSLVHFFCIIQRWP